MSAPASLARPREPASRGHRLSRRAKTSASTALLVLAAAYVVVPIYWLVVASSKNTSELFATNTFLLPAHPSWLANFSSLFHYESGDYRWRYDLKLWITHSLEGAAYLPR